MRYPARTRAVPKLVSFCSSDKHCENPDPNAPGPALKKPFDTGELQAPTYAVSRCQAHCQSASSPTTKFGAVCQLSPTCPPNSPPVGLCRKVSLKITLLPLSPLK